MHRWALAAILTAQVALGCICTSWPDASELLAKSDAVFFGKVLSEDSGRKAPYDLHPERGIQEKYRIYGMEWVRLLESDAPSAVAIQKELLREIAAPKYQKRIESIRTHAEFTALYERMHEEGVWTRFSVTETLKGSAQSTVDLWQQVSSCLMPFHRGEKYLIYAWRNKEGRLTPGACGGARAVSAAADELRYLRTVKARPASSVRFFGQIGNVDPRNAAVLGGGVADPVLGVEVRLKAAHGNWSFTTGAGGGFRFDGLRGGDYTLTVHTLPTSYAPARLLHGPVEIALPARGYLKRNFLLAPDRISKE